MALIGKDAKPRWGESRKNNANANGPPILPNPQPRKKESDLGGLLWKKRSSGAHTYLDAFWAEGVSCSSPELLPAI